MKINYKMMLFKTLCNIVYSDFVVTSKRKVIVQYIHVQQVLIFYRASFNANSFGQGHNQG